MASDANDRDRVSRRRFIELTGLTGAAALAGCAGDGDGDGDTPTDTDESGNGDGSPAGGDTATDTPGTNVVDQAHKNSGQAVPPDTHFNIARDQNYDWNTGFYVFERFAAWNFQDNEFKMAALSDWEIGDETITLNIRDDLRWENGDDVTAQDIVTQFRILEKIGATVWDFTDSVEAVDDKTVQLNLSSTVNSTIAQFALATRRVGFPHSVYEEYLDQDASAVQQFEWTEPIASGAFSLESRNSQEFRFSRNDEYYNADNVNYSEQRVVYRDGNTAIQQGLASGDLEGSTSLFVPAETVETFPDEVVEITPPAKWGYGMIINHDDPIFGRRSVRQAIAHVINRQALVDNAGPRTKFPAPKPCGIAPRDQERWLGDQFDNFKGYGVESSQNQQAAQILRDDGFTKSGGTWQDPDGNPVQAEYLSPAGWTDFTTMTETAVDQLSSFGFDMSVNTLPTSDWTNRYINSNFKIGARQWLPGGARSSFPYFPLRHQIQYTGINGGHNFPEGDRTVPAMDGDGEMTVNPRDLIEQISQAGEDEVDSLIQRAAWHNNHDLPMISLVSKFEQSWLVDNDRWDVVGDEDARRQVKWPPHWLPRQGGMTATNE